MKTKWITPRTEIETFIPNEYIAACWGVHCFTGLANDYEKRNGYWDNRNVSHTEDHCGNITNQLIIDRNGDNIAEQMIETGTDGLGRLPCTIYTDINYNVERPISSVNIGSTIFWTTTSGSRTWHHQGVVTRITNEYSNASI